LRAKRRVALIVETSSNYGRTLLKGIVRFMRTHDDWSVFVEQRDVTAKPPEWLKHWQGHGIISRSTTQKLADAVAATGTPLVELTDRREDLGFPHIWSNDAMIGRLAAEHLIERGFGHFGFCGFKSEAWSARRQHSFAKSVGDDSTACEVYNSSVQRDSLAEV
jgi:LacI family transcriptional regulator